MSGSRATVLAGCVALSAAGAAQCADGLPEPAKEARTFLLRYVGLTATSDIGALAMYRDDARVRVSAWQGGREIQAGVTSGKDWKQQLRAGWFEGVTKLEASSFQDAKVSARGQRLVIHARRYSQTRCYWDDGYAVAIEPDKAGQYQIVEERLMYQRDAFCPRPAGPQRAHVGPSGGPQPTAMLALAVTSTATSAGRLNGLPANVVPSGQGVPRVPAPMGATPDRVGAPPPPGQSRPAGTAVQPQQ